MNTRARSMVAKGVVAVFAAASMLESHAVSAAVDYACVSLIGDALTTIERQASSGANTPKRRSVATEDPSHARDKLAASAAMSALNARKPDAIVATVDVSGPGTEPFFTTPLAGVNDPAARDLYGQLAVGIAREAEAKRVLVIAKLEFRHWSEPYVLSGVGVFAEPGPRDMPANEQTIERRYLAPYLGAALLVFDADGKLVATQALALHTTYRSERGKPIPSTVWQILSAEELDRAVNQLVVDGVGTAMTRLPL